ncbi:MAG: isoprenylcysteine carboxylmethyltransferase family protein [Aliishimia sp.]
MNLPVVKMIDIPPAWLLAFAVLVWGLGQIMPMPGGTQAVRLLGTMIVAAGVGLIFLAAWQFRQHKTTIIPHRHASSLITSGVFSITRNPIYLADAIILVGLCLRWGIVQGLVFVPLFVILIQMRFIRDEEDRLRTAFGAEFETYVRNTRRWL